MKKITLSFLLFAFVISAHSQSIVFNGGTITIQAGGQITSDGGLTLDGTGTIVNDGNFTVKGNVVNNFTNTGSSLGNWTLNGTLNQSISGSANMVVNNLTVDNLAGLTLNKVVKVNGALNLTNGIITASSAANPLILGTAATIPTTPTNVKHVNGYVVKEGTTAFTYPTGNGSIYQPVGIAPASSLPSNTNGISAKYNVGSPGGTNGGLDSYNTGEYWDLAPFNGGTANSKVVIYWDGVNDNTTTAVSERKVGHLSMGAMLNHGGTASMTSILANGNITSDDNISTWSPFVLGFKAATPLPISLISFEGKSFENYNQLKWETSTEINASHFEIERSNSQAFENIGKVEANNLQNEKSIYSFDDNSPLVGINYYRLKLVDLNNKYEYSKIIKLSNSENAGVVGFFFPNPINESKSNVNIIAKEKGVWTIQQFDEAGRLIGSESRTLDKGLNKVSVDKTNIGASLFRFENKDTTVVRKLIKN